MRTAIKKLKPISGFSHFVHIGLNLLLPIIVFALVRNRFYQIAAIIILLSKWRMLAVRPRYWPAHVRANAVDIIFGISILVFMAHVNTQAAQLLLAVIYGLWLVFLKPVTSVWGVSLQALIGQTAGLMAIFMAWGSAPRSVLVLVVGAVCYLAARHFFMIFEEVYASLYAHIWAYFAAAMAWILSHWLLYYGVVAQPTLLLTVIGFGLAALYYLGETERLSVLWRRQFIFIMVAIIVVVLLFSDWSSKIL
jgi:hypothetical protein